MENFKCIICVIFLFTYNEFIVICTDSLDCNFDYGLCNWRQDQSDDFNWTRWSGETPTPDTGPDADHTSGGGFYVYIDTSEVGNNKKAKLISAMKSPGKYCFSLWYYMYGEDVRFLKLSTRQVGDRNEELLFRIRGQTEERKWIFEQTEIDTDKHFEVVIEGRVKNRNEHDFGDIAIDDIVMFSSNKCPTDCGDPVSEFGFANTDNISIGSTLKITCLSGYKITGSPLIVCQANGTWSDSTVCNPIDCGEPTLNSGLLVTNSKETTYNKTFMLTCEGGFTLIGNASLTCQADGNWTAQPNCAINNSEVSSMIAVYVTVPLILIVIAVILIVYIWRKRKTQSIQEHESVKDVINQANSFHNKTYNDQALTRRKSEPDKQQLPDEGYATITGEEQVEPHVYYNTFGAECRIQKDIEHHYDHAKNTSKSVQSNTYSHVRGNKLEKEWTPNNDANPNPYNSKGYKRADSQPGNDSYDHLNAIHLSECTKQDNSMTVNDNEEAEYDHAKSGGKDPVPFEQDDYSHLRDVVNQESTEKNMYEHDKYGSFNVVESTGKIDKMGNERNAEYEQPIGHSPQYFILEVETDNTHRDDRTKFVLEAEGKSDENYESYNHAYFVLEKTESA